MIVNGRWEFDLRELRIGFGPEIIDPQQDDIIHGFEYSVHLRDDQIFDADEFFDDIKGQAYPFWLPGPAYKFKIENPDSDESSSSSSDAAGIDSFLITEQGADDSLSLHPDRYLYFTKTGETAFTAKVSSITDNGDGTETVTLTENLTVDLDNTWHVQPLYFVRLADNVERIRVMAERFQIRTYRVVELPQDYALISTGVPQPTEPVFLYRFTAELSNGDNVWRYTSHPTDVEVELTNFQSSSSSSSQTGTSSSQSSSSSRSSQGESSSSSTEDAQTTSSSSTSSSNSFSLTSSSSSSSSSSSQSSASSSSSSSSSTEQSLTSDASEDESETWIAVPIEHSGLSRSAKFGGKVNIAADVDSVEPLRLLVPMRMPVPLKLEILKTNTSLTETETLFVGYIKKPSVLGRRITVSASEWGDAMDQRIPDFFIQRDCNYRVYDEFTCRAVKADFQKSANIIAQAGRQLTIEDASLAGLAADYFAQGWIEIGSGLTKKIAFIIENTIAFGNQMIITVSLNLDLELPIGVTVVPGCTGQRSICISKFNNLVNFGGHATPRDNLTLTAIRTEATTGGKK